MDSFICREERGRLTNLQQERTVKTSDEQFHELYATLDDHEKAMYADLELDRAEAEENAKKLFGFLKFKDGEYRLVLLRRQCAFVKELKKDKVHVSNLVLDDKDSLSTETFMKLIRLLRMQGYRISGPEYHDKCESFGIDYGYFTFNFDFNRVA